MPFKYIPREGHQRRKYSPDRMRQAIKSVVEDRSSVRAASVKFNIARKTLERYVNKSKIPGNEEMSLTPKYNSGQVLTDHMESLLEEYLITSSKLHYGLTPKAMTSFVYEFAVLNNLKYPPSWVERKSAGYDWLRGFMSRHKKLSLRHLESTSSGRSTVFNKANVTKFYDNLREVLQKHNFGSESIYNIDDSGITTVHKPGKIISVKGEKQVAKVTSGERGTLVTICCAISAIGSFVPPFFVFPRHRVTDAMKKVSPSGSRAVAHPSGWMTRDNFDKFLEHFIYFSKASKNNPVLIILDNHDSHITPSGINLCKENGITMVTLPPHTSHKLQPLDRTVFGPFKSFYNQAADDFMVVHPGQPIKIQDIPELVGKAFPKTFTPLNIQKGFACTGIYPFNSDLFTESDFLGVYVSDRPPPDQFEIIPSAVSNEPEKESVSANSRSLPSTSGISSLQFSAKASILTNNNDITNATQNSMNATETSKRTSFILLPEDVRPYPKAGPRKVSRGGRKPRSSLILTNTPNKNLIEEEYKQKLDKHKKKEPKIKKVKKKVLQLSSSSEEEDDARICVNSDEDMDPEEFDGFESQKREIGDFALIKFATKTTVYHYVGKILSKLSSSEYEVTFLRRPEHNYLFIYPEREDKATVVLDDMIKLPQPLSKGGTERAVLKISFNFNFLPYKNVR